MQVTAKCRDERFAEEFEIAVENTRVSIELQHELERSRRSHGESGTSAPDKLALQPRWQLSSTESGRCKLCFESITLAELAFSSQDGRDIDGVAAVEPMICSGW